MPPENAVFEPESNSVPAPVFTSDPPEPFVMMAEIVRSVAAAVESPTLSVLALVPKSKLPDIVAPLGLFVASNVTFPASVKMPEPVVALTDVPEIPLSVRLPIDRLAVPTNASIAVVAVAVLALREI